MKSIKLVTTTLVVSGLAFMSCKNDYKTKDTEVDTVEEQVEDLENEIYFLHLHAIVHHS